MPLLCVFMGNSLRNGLNTFSRGFKMIKVVLAYFLAALFLVRCHLGLQASLSYVEDEKLMAMQLFFKGEIPAHSHFKAQKGRAAAGVMVIAKHEGRLYTLLGKRDDTRTWCNFGGKTEDGQTCLNETAAQELMEESCGLYACPAGALHQNPSHTLQLENVTYRMYMRDFKYLKSAYFKERMGKATAGSSLEYTDFVWVELESLLSGNPILHPDEGVSMVQEGFELFSDFHTMLKEPVVRNILSNWGKKDLVLSTPSDV